MPLSPPFASREFNGEVLLEELDELRHAQVKQQALNDCALAMRDIGGRRAQEASLRIKSLAQNRFSQQPALGSLLTRWSLKLKSDEDVAALVSHFERVAFLSAMISSVMRGQERLSKGPANAV
jgi:hypothetical protein